jgi:CheY-like chemotaxis protein
MKATDTMWEMESNESPASEGKPGDLRRPREILLVEDNPADVRLVEEALKRTEVPCNLSVAEDGVEALAFLRRERRQFAEAPRPDLILLDLNMRLKDGRQTLSEIKSDGHLKCIPVVVFTTSRHERDVFNAYDRHANTYVVKPPDLKAFVRAIQSIADYWFSTAEHLLR